MFNLLQTLSRMTGSVINKVQAGQLFDEAYAHYSAQDYARAFPLMKDSAERGSPHAMAHLAIMCLKGQGTPMDWCKAAELFVLTLEVQDASVAEVSRSTVLSNLGLIYGIGGYGLKRDAVKAEGYLRQAVDEGDQSSLDVLRMLKARKGPFGQKERARPDIKW